VAPLVHCLRRTRYKLPSSTALAFPEATGFDFQREARTGAIMRFLARGRVGFYNV